MATNLALLDVNTLDEDKELVRLLANQGATTCINHLALLEKELDAKIDFYTAKHFEARIESKRIQKKYDAIKLQNEKFDFKKMERIRRVKDALMDSIQCHLCGRMIEVASVCQYCYKVCLCFSCNAELTCDNQDNSGSARCVFCTLYGRNERVDLTFFEPVFEMLRAQESCSN